MKSGLDLSKFKKVSSDGSSSTLRHADGHELKIAHKALDSKMRAELHKLPVHAAEGTPPLEADAPLSQPDFTVSGSGDFGGAPAPAEPVAAPAGAQPGLTEGESLMPAEQAPETAPAEPAEVPQGGPPSSTTEPPATLPEPVLPPIGPPPTAPEVLKQHAAMYAKAVEQGTITPKTFGQMFGNKDTPGKVGTLFGLLIAGAGAGLTHQPNAVMAMMEKELQNDLQAQQNSKSNAQNFLRLSQEFQMNQSVARRNEIENRLTLAKTALQPELANLYRAQAQSALVHAGAAKTHADVAAQAQALMMMNISQFKSFVDTVNKLPPGSPARVKGEQTLAVMLPMMSAKNAEIADIAGAAGAVATMINPGGQGEGGSEESFGKRQAGLNATGHGHIAKNEADRHIPGVGEASVPISHDDKAAIISRESYQKRLEKAIHFAKSHSGSLSPDDVLTGRTIMDSLKESPEAGKHFGSLLEGADPSKFFGNLRVLPKLEALASDSAAQLDSRIKAVGIPKGYKRTRVGDKAKDRSGNEIYFDGDNWKKVAPKKGK